MKYFQKRATLFILQKKHQPYNVVCWGAVHAGWWFFDV